MQSRPKGKPQRNTVASERGFVEGINSLLLIGMELRHPATDETEAVEALVQTVVDEIYGGLWTSPPIPIGPTDWSPGWVAIGQRKIIGVALTGGERVEDLWIAANARGVGVGSALLSRCETEIREWGFCRARLRVASSNKKAISFYEAQGWLPEREYPHEKLPVTMTDMRKDL
jgi:ribosomal protein S18 acetylase RimI-like enzyme